MIEVAYYFKTLLALGAVLGILYVFLRISKVAYNQKFLGEMKIIDQLPVENNVKLVIVQVRDQQFLLSVCSKQIQILEKLTPA